MILSVDPGVHHHGCALWEDGEMAVAWMTKRDASLLEEMKQRVPVSLVTVLVFEKMQIYARTGLAQANDCISVSVAAGIAIGEIQIQGYIEQLVEYKPRDWKGTVPKPIMTKRIIRTLSVDERCRAELPSAKSTQHNVWDGAGIGLKYWGRL